MAPERSERSPSAEEDIVPVDRRVAEDIVPVYRGAEGVQQWKTSCPSTEEQWKTSCPSTEDAAAELAAPVTIDAFKRKL